MINKFEIKSHDGPGRLGKYKDKLTPLLLNQKRINIAPSEETAYNIDKEIAIWSVNKTIEKSRSNIKNNDIAVIQGSKYIDLRIECGKKLEKIGYNGFLIANGDDLLLHPKDLVNLIVGLRENLKPKSYLIFPFAEPSFMPLLTYMGIDGFLDDSAKYYSYLNILLTQTKAYNLDEYDIYENKSREEIEKFNKNTLDFVLREIKSHMKNKSLRNLVEERANTSPQNTSALKILDREYKEYLLKHTQLY